jgi:hypothetical protein
MFFLVFPPAASGVTLSLVPSAPEVPVGGVVTVDVAVADLGTDVVGGYSLSLQYDATILDPVSAVLGSALGDPALEQIAFPDPPVPPAVAGTFAISAVSLLSVSELSALQTGTTVLLSIDFQVLAEGISQISVGSALLSGGVGNALPLGPIEGVEVAATPAVPEPSAALAFLAGCLLVGRAIGRRGR